MSSVQKVGIGFPAGMYKALCAYASREKCTFGYAVRKFCIDGLRAENINIVVDNPQWGERSDLRTRTPAEERELNKELKERFSKKKT